VPRLQLTAVLAVAFASALAALGPEAGAKVSQDSTYGFDRTWNAAIRLVRVDLGLKVVEKDESTGYLLFEYRSSEAGNKSSPGAIEVVRGKDGDPVKVVVQLSQMPQYHEQVLLDSLTRKLRAEYGDPPPKARPAPPASKKPPPDDAGADATP